MAGLVTYSLYLARFFFHGKVRYIRIVWLFIFWSDGVQLLEYCSALELDRQEKLDSRTLNSDWRASKLDHLNMNLMYPNITTCSGSLNLDDVAFGEL